MSKQRGNGQRRQTGIRFRGKRRDGTEKWEARVPDPARPTLQIGRTFSSEAEAKRWRAKQLAAQGDGDWIDPRKGDQTFAVVAEAWRKSWTNRLDARTRHGYEHYLSAYLLPQWSRAPVSAITPLVIQDWVHALQTGGYRHNKRGEATPLAPNTVRHIYAAMRAAMKKAVQLRMTKANPCTDVDLPSPRRREMLFLSEAEILSLAQAMPTQQDRLVVLLAAYTGLRAGELWALKRGDVDLRTRQLIVDESLKDVAGHLEFGEPKTANSRRSLALPSFLCEELAAFMPALGRADELLFRDSHGGAVRHGNWYRRTFRPTVKRALPDKPGLRFHDLRHTAASLLIRAGAHPKLVSMRLGHGSIEITLDRYGHLFPSADEVLAGALDNLYNAPASGAEVTPLRKAE